MEVLISNAPLGPLLIQKAQHVSCQDLGPVSASGGASGRVLSPDQLIALWETIDARVEELLEGVEPLPASHSPFDPRSTFSVEEQK